MYGLISKTLYQNKSMRRAIPLLVLAYFSIISNVTANDSHALTLFDYWICQVDSIPFADAGSITITCSEIDTFTLDGSNSSIGPEFEYLWTNFDGDTISTEIVTMVLGLNGYTLTVTNILTGETASDNVRFIESRDSPSIMTSSMDFVSCLKDTVILKVEVESFGEEVSILWTGPSIVSDPSLAEIAVDQAGLYSVIVTKLNNACSVSESLFVSNDFDQPNFSIDQIGSITCVDSTVILDAIFDNSLNLSFLWEGSNGSISDSTSVEVGEGFYTLTVTNLENGCASSSSFFVDSSTDFIVLSTRETICGSETFIDPSTLLESFPFSGLDLADGFWEEQDGLIIDSFPIAQVTLEGDYKFILNDSIGCTALEITYMVEFIPGITANAGPDQIFNCTENELVLVGTASSPSSNLSFNWFTEDGFFLSGVTNDSVLVGSSGSYRLLTSDLNTGCSSLDTLVVFDDPNAPIVDIAVSNISCFGANDGMIDFEVSGGVPPYVVTSSSPSQTDLSAGPYSIQAIDAIGCMIESTIEITEPRDLTVAINISKGGNLLAEVIGGTPEYTFLWNTDVDSALIVNPIQNTEYFVTIVDANGCRAEDSFFYQVNTTSNLGIDDFDVFPNPTDDYVIVQLDNIADYLVEMSIVDLHERALPLSYKVISPDQVVVELKHFNPGIYLVKIVINKKANYFKIVKL